ncbi:MAG: hypothetical protein V4667_10085 [Bacteroidota bacterium]
MHKSYLDYINEYPEETKKEFLLIVKASFNTFFSEIEVAIKNKDTDTILKLIHKEFPTLIMLELKSAQQFFSQLKDTTITSSNCYEILTKVNQEKNQIINQGWL